MGDLLILKEIKDHKVHNDSQSSQRVLQLLSLPDL